MSKDNKWEMGTDQEAILENERLSFINKLPTGLLCIKTSNIALVLILKEHKEFSIRELNSAIPFFSNWGPILDES